MLENYKEIKMVRIKRIYVTIIALLLIGVNFFVPTVGAATHNPTNNTVDVSSSDIKYTVDFGTNTHAVQNFYVNGSDLYTSQRYDGYVKITYFRIQNNVPYFQNEMWLEDAGHGQTLEVYTYDGETYLLVSLKEYLDGDNVWSIQIGRVKYTPCTQSNAIKYTDCKRFVQLTYANEDNISFGTIKRVDAAISSDNSTILIWKRNIDNNNEMTGYDFNAFNEALSNAESNYVSFKNNATMQSNVEFSFNDEGVVNSIPSSVQGVELSNEKNGLHSIYISSGDEKNGDIKIYRFNSNGTKKAEKKITHTDFMNENLLEIEGIHIVGNTLQFLLVNSTISGQAVNKQKQYIMNIDKQFLV